MIKPRPDRAQIKCMTQSLLMSMERTASPEIIDKYRNIIATPTYCYGDDIYLIDENGDTYISWISDAYEFMKKCLKPLFKL
jgi:hypothetical protein